jgi:hypothetical protein
MFVRRYGLSLKSIKGARKWKPLKKYEVKRAIEAINRALSIAMRELPLHTSHYSRKDFTLQQLYAILALKQELDTDYRTTTIVLAVYPEMREAIGLDKVPHYSTLSYAYKRLPKKDSLFRYWR